MGYLDAAAGAGSDVLDGSFVIELAACENAETGRVIEWPPSPRFCCELRAAFQVAPYDVG